MDLEIGGGVRVCPYEQEDNSSLRGSPEKIEGTVSKFGNQYRLHHGRLGTSADASCA